MTLAVCLLIIAGLTAFGTLVTLSTATKAGTAVAVTIMNVFCIAVEILSAFHIMHGG